MVPNFKAMISPLLLVLLFLLNKSFCDDVKDARHFDVPLVEILPSKGEGKPVYIMTTSTGEIVVSSTSRGSDLSINDYLMAVDGKRVLNGGLDTFLTAANDNKETEVLIPVVDSHDTDVKGGARLLGFLSVNQHTQGRKLSVRRGEVVYDFEEAGPAPDMQVGNVVIST